jgi:hypothetical protein
VLCYCNDCTIPYVYWKLFFSVFHKTRKKGNEPHRRCVCDRRHNSCSSIIFAVHLYAYISIMFTALKEACITLGAISFVYSVALNITRHATKDDKSVFDTIQDVAINSSALAISWIIYKRCIDEDLCMVRN